MEEIQEKRIDTQNFEYKSSKHQRGICYVKSNEGAQNQNAVINPYCGLPNLNNEFKYHCEQAACDLITKEETISIVTLLKEEETIDFNESMRIFLRS